MTARSFSTISVRLFGAWLITRSVLALPGLILWHRDLLLGGAGTHRRFYDAGATYDISSSGDIYYVIRSFIPAFTGVGCSLAFGIFVVLVSSSLGRLISHGIDTSTQNDRSA